jgi:V/A-type H+-transporting ATPase subunit E
MTVTGSAPQGVQELIDRIRDQGVTAARESADRIIQDAEGKAAKLLKEARDEAARMRETAEREIEAYRSAANEALKLSARDTVLQLKSRVTDAFESFVQRLVTTATRDEEFIRTLVLVLAGHSVDEFVKDQEIQVLLSEAILTGRSDEKLRAIGKQAILGLSSDMLREGIELLGSADVEGGARVRLIDAKLEIDLSDKAVTKMLGARLLPRFRAILEGIE